MSIVQLLSCISFAAAAADFSIVAVQAGEGKRLLLLLLGDKTRGQQCCYAYLLVRNTLPTMGQRQKAIDRTSSGDVRHRVQNSTWRSCLTDMNKYRRRWRRNPLDLTDRSRVGSSSTRAGKEDDFPSICCLFILASIVIGQVGIVALKLQIQFAN